MTIRMRIKRAGEDWDLEIETTADVDRPDEVMRFHRDVREKIDELTVKHFGKKGRDCGCSGS